MPNLTPGYQIADRMSGGRRQQAQDTATKSVHDWVKIYNSADNPAEKKLALEYGRLLVSHLPEEHRKPIEKMIQLGPFGNENLKREQWMLNHEIPKVTADSNTMPDLYARQTFRQRDAIAKREEVSTGQKQPEENMFGVGENLWAVRDAKNKQNVSIISSEDFEKMGQASKFNLPTGAFLPDGKAKTGNKKTMTHPNGIMQQDEQYVDYKNNITWETTGISREIKETSEDKAFRKFYTDFLNMNKDNALVARVSSAMDDGDKIQDIVDNIINPIFPGYKIIPKGKYKETWGGLGKIDIEGLQLLFFKGVKRNLTENKMLYDFWWSMTPQGEVIVYNDKGMAYKGNEIQALIDKGLTVPPEFEGKI